MSQGKQTKQQKNGRSSIPTAFQPKLFTLYPLQAFAAVSVTTFYASFRCFGRHRCDHDVREQAKSKVRSSRPAPSCAYRQ